MEKEFTKENALIYLAGKVSPVRVSWIGITGGRAFFVEVGSLLVVSIPESTLEAIVFDAAQAA